MLQDIRERKAAYQVKLDKMRLEEGSNEEHIKETDVSLDKERRERNQNIIDYVQKWLNNIEVTNAF